uniref:Uncharacterized protein n=1 Tax=Nelumbo nucifera TaxID=4432 RepID=A0A822YLD8_NELNU|nr:TPA_asm: hypothetical protein HUJ06_012251 [Nelumbo nucifera]
MGEDGGRANQCKMEIEGEIDCWNALPSSKDAGKVAEGMAIGITGSRWEKTKELPL